MTSTTPDYEQARVAVDPVIFTINEDQLYVYLNQREIEPFIHQAELPGGLLLQNETAEETLSRKLHDTIGNKNIYFQQFHTFSQPKRDPRTRTVTIGFVALVPHSSVADMSKFYRLNNLPQMAFDHKKIVEDANAYLKNNLNAQTLKQFMPTHFPLNQLQMVYEVVGQKKVDNRNFRKKMITSGIVKKSAKKQQAVAHRPAQLYQFAD